MKAGMKKGQMVFEFVISTVIFFGLVIYVMNYVGYSSNVLRNENYQNGLDAISTHLSEAIVKTEGVWSGSTPTFPGVSSEWPVLNTTKIGYLGSFCSANDLSSILSGGNRIKISISDSYGTVWADCGNDPPDTYSKTTRYAVNESGSRIIVDVYAW